MSVAINNLINFSRSLPAPFDTLTSKKVKVSSKYGSGTEATPAIAGFAAACSALHATLAQDLEQEKKLLEEGKQKKEAVDG